MYMYIHKRRDYQKRFIGEIAKLVLIFFFKTLREIFFHCQSSFGHKKILPSGKITVTHNTLTQAPVLRASAVCLPMSILPTSLYRA